MRKTRTFLIALTCALVAPSAAAASVTVGPENPNPDPGITQAINWPSGSLLFTSAAPPGVQLTAPTDGVITSWRLYTDRVGTGATAQLRTLTPAGSKTYAVNAAGPVEPLAPIEPVGAQKRNVLHSFKAQVPISAGQIVGVSLTRAEGSYILPLLPYEENSAWEYGCLGASCASPVPTDGKAATATQITTQWVAMNAQLELDVDRDGLGDETQDPCVGACPAIAQPVVTPPAATPKKKCGKRKKLKRGKCVKKRKKRKGKSKH